MTKLFIAQPYDVGIDRLRGTVSQQQIALQFGDAFFAYLQSLPSTIPSEPNMPWWDNDVLKRSSVAATFSFFRPGGTDSYIRPSTGTYLRA